MHPTWQKLNTSCPGLFLCRRRGPENLTQPRTLEKATKKNCPVRAKNTSTRTTAEQIHQQISASATKLLTFSFLKLMVCKISKRHQERVNGMAWTGPYSRVWVGRPVPTLHFFVFVLEENIWGTERSKKIIYDIGHVYRYLWDIYIRHVYVLHQGGF